MYYVYIRYIARGGVTDTSGNTVFIHCIKIYSPPTVTVISLSTAADFIPNQFSDTDC